MITNSVLIQYTSPVTPDARGGRAAGTTTAYAAGSRACVDRPRRSQLIAAANKIAGITGVIYMPLATTPVPATGGQIKYLIDGMTDATTVEILDLSTMSHDDQSHFEIMVKNV